MQEKGTGKEVGSCTPVKTGMGIGNEKAAPERVEKGLEEERWLHRYTRMKGDRKGKMTVFLERFRKRDQKGEGVKAVPM